MIRKSSVALRAVTEQALYIAEDSPFQAERFLDAVESTLEEIEATPGMGRAYPFASPRLSGLRLVHVTGFPNHLIFYRQIDQGIDFVHLLHAARDIPAVLAEDL